MGRVEEERIGELADRDGLNFMTSDAIDDVTIGFLPFSDIFANDIIKIGADPNEMIIYL